MQKLLDCPRIYFETMYVLSQITFTFALCRGEIKSIFFRNVLCKKCSFEKYFSIFPICFSSFFLPVSFTTFLNTLIIQHMRSIQFPTMNKWENILPHVRFHFLVRTSSARCTVPLFILELSVPLLPHVHFHSNMHYPFLAPARIREHCPVSGLG